MGQGHIHVLRGTILGLAVLLAGSGCSLLGGLGLGGNDEGLSGTDTRDSGSPFPPPDTGCGSSVNGFIQGHVSVQLYTLDEQGDVSYVDWDQWEGGYPFGPIWVSAFTEDPETGELEYHAQQVLYGADTEGSDYELDIYAPGHDTVQVFAVLDYWDDRILNSWDPTGYYPEPVTVTCGDTVSGIDIEILARVYETSGEGGGGLGLCEDCYGGSGGEGCDSVVVSGDVHLETWEFRAASPARVLFNDPDGTGPYYASSAVYLHEADDSDGNDYVGSWSAELCSNRGQMDVFGVWDANGNGMYDPADDWGALANADGEELNPLEIGSEDLPNQDVYIPVEGAGLRVIPFVRLTGEVSSPSGTFDDYFSSGASFDAYDGTNPIYVAALKYRPEGEFDASVLDEAYDVEVIEPSEWSGKESVPYELHVPANSLLYLWAYADVVSPLGTLNQHCEPVAANGENENGRITTTTSNREVDLLLWTEEGCEEQGEGEDGD